MKKLLLSYVLYAVLFLVIVILFHQWFDLGSLIFLAGGLVGSLLPEVDHLLYMYLLKPEEMTSKITADMINRRDVQGTLNVLADTREERKNLIFHNAAFQWLFIVFAFLALTSSSSLFGKGLVLAFLVHLSIDQIIDLTKTNSLANWFDKVNLHPNKQQATIYWAAVLALIFFMGLFLA